MSDKRISELVNLTSLAADDEFVVVDADANATKRTTYDTLATEVRTESEPLSGTTGTFTGDITSNGETVYHRGNVVGTVSESSGDPTGAVIERGSNANGEYVKFADGTMISTFFGSLPGTSLGRNIWTFPVQFASTPPLLLGDTASTSIDVRNTRFMSIYTRNDSSAAWITKEVRTTSATGTVSANPLNDCNMLAIGRWY